MLLLNFSHPLTEEQQKQVEALTGRGLPPIRQVPVQLDTQQPFVPQISALVEACQLTPAEWQTTPLLIIPPALNFIALTLFAEIHGRAGYFPAIIRIRPVADSLPPQYEVAEILNLQHIRDQARTQRF